MNLADIYKYVIAKWNANFALSPYTLYAYEVPEGQCHPVCSYNLVNNNRQFTTCRAMDTFYLQLNVFTTDEQMSTGLALRDEIVRWFEKDSATGSEYHIEMISVINTGHIRDFINKGHHFFVELEIWTDDTDEYYESSSSSS